MTTPTAPAPMQVTLAPVTPADLPTLIDIQFQCFNHSVLIEQIANPDTPATRRAMLAQHQRHIDEDPGLRIVKATVKPDSASDEEKIVGFCMFYVPTRSSEQPGEITLPLPLRPRVPATTTTSPDDTPPADTIAAPTALELDTETPIALSRTNIATLIPHRQNLLSSLVEASPNGHNGVGYVRYMSVEPGYRRHGIGRVLMEWGCALFDAEGVDAYLEATAEGEPLYRRCGFGKVEEQVLEVDGVVGARYAIMWRAGKGRTVESRRVT